MTEKKSQDRIDRVDRIDCIALCNIEEAKCYLKTLLWRRSYIHRTCWFGLAVCQWLIIKIKPKIGALQNRDSIAMILGTLHLTMNWVSARNSCRLSKGDCHRCLGQLLLGPAALLLTALLAAPAIARKTRSIVTLYCHIFDLSNHVTQSLFISS